MFKDKFDLFNIENIINVLKEKKIVATICSFKHRYLILIRMEK